MKTGQLVSLPQRSKQSETVTEVAALILRAGCDVLAGIQSMTYHVDCRLHETFGLVPDEGAQAAGAEHGVRDAVQAEVFGTYALPTIVHGPKRYEWCHFIFAPNYANPPEPNDKTSLALVVLEDCAGRSPNAIQELMQSVRCDEGHCRLNVGISDRPATFYTFPLTPRTMPLRRCLGLLDQHPGSRGTMSYPWEFVYGHHIIVSNSEFAATVPVLPDHLLPWLTRTPRRP